jgi:hypothetical protein
MALALLGLLWAQAAPAAEVIFDTASQSESLLKRETSARVAALGGNGASLEVGVDSLFSNPAVLARMQGMELGVHHQSWLANINQESADLAAPTGWGTWGLGLGWVDYGTFDAVDAQGQSQGTVAAQDYSFDVAWARAVGAGLSIGGAARYIREALADQVLSESVLDLGLYWTQDRWQVGLLFANVASTALSGDRGPSAMRGEVSGDLMARPGQLHANVGFSAEPGGLSRIQAGLESNLYPVLTARLGYEARLGSTLLEGFSGATFGLGFSLGPADIDYAFLPFGDLGSGQRLSLKWRFANPKPSPRPAPTPELTPEPVLVPPLLPPAPRPLVLAPPSLPALMPTAQPTAVPTVETSEMQFKVTEDSLENARRLEDAGHLDEAVAVHQNLLGLYPHNPKIWRSLGDLQYRAGHHDQALQAYDKAFENGLDDADLKTWVAKYRSQP